MLRLLALKHGLDPDTTLPEDLLLLMQNKDGDYLVQEEAKWAGAWIEAERVRAEARKRREHGQ